MGIGSGFPVFTKEFVFHVKMAIGSCVAMVGFMIMITFGATRIAEIINNGYDRSVISPDFDSIKPGDIVAHKLGMIGIVTAKRSYSVEVRTRYGDGNIQGWYPFEVDRKLDFVPDSPSCDSVPIPGE